MILTDSNKEQFWSHVKRGTDGECWPWQACRSHRGYGLFGVKLADGRRMNRNASRIAWVITHGPIASSKILVCHRCDNPPCCNPAHLFLGSTKDNAEDMVAKGRNKDRRGQANGASKLRDEDVIEIRVSEESQHAIARRKGISQGLVSMIRNRKIWAHL